MREPAFSAVMRRRLAGHGLPAARIERITRELSDHWEDLCAAAIERGLPAPEAAAEADLRLGHPEQLAARLIAGFRRGSWLGRHPILGLCVVPLFLAPLLMGAVALPLYWVAEAAHLSLPGHPWGLLDLHLVTGILWGLYYTTAVASVSWLCWRGWMAGLGVRWVLAMCSWCALTALVRFFDADPIKHRIVMGLTFPYRLNIHTASLLLIHAVAAAVFLMAARQARRATHTQIHCL